MIIAVDPGKTTGVASFTEDGDVISFGEIKWDEFHSWLHELQDVTMWVVEDYKIRPAGVQGGYGHEWNDGKALQIIGAIKYHAWAMNAEVVLQQPSIKPVAYRVLGMEYKKGKKGMHIYDALAHGKYWFHTNKRYVDGLAGQGKV